MSASAARAPVEAVWPDWTGEACAIIASGPSVKRSEVERLRGRLRVLAIKRNVELAPWADAVYGCDPAWWRSVRGLPDFAGLKACEDGQTCRDFGLSHVTIPTEGPPQLKARINRLLTGETGVIGSGGNSGFQALNLAVQFGANRILLVGFDHSGEHWYGRNGWHGANNPDGGCFNRWRSALVAAAPVLRGLGVEVVNASPWSTVKVFPRRTIDQALAGWGV